MQGQVSGKNGGGKINVIFDAEKGINKTGTLSIGYDSSGVYEANYSIDSDNTLKFGASSVSGGKNVYLDFNSIDISNIESIIVYFKDVAESDIVAHSCAYSTLINSTTSESVSNSNDWIYDSQGDFMPSAIINDGTYDKLRVGFWKYGDGESNVYRNIRKIILIKKGA